MLGVGAIALIAWVFDLEALTRLGLHTPAMRANSAACFVLVGLAMLLLQAGHRRSSRWLALVVLVIAAATLAEQIFGLDLGIDQLLTDDHSVSQVGAASGRMGMNTATCFALAGLSLLCLETVWRRIRPTELAAAMIGGLSLLTVLGYAYGVPRAETGFITAKVTPMSLSSAILFAIVAVGVTVAQTDADLIALARSRSAGGVQLRRLFIAAVVLPAVVGYACLQGQRSGYFGTEARLALFTAALTVVFSWLVVRTARALERADAGRAAVQTRMEGLAAIVESSRDAIIGTDFDGTIMSWNSAAQHLFGYSASEMLGQTGARLYPIDAEDRDVGALLARIGGGETVEQESQRLKKDGTQVTVAQTIFPILDKHGEVLGAAAIMRDMTERRRLEAQLRQAQKMEAVGQLAGGIAHDFNNLLLVIGGYTEIARREIGVGPGIQSLTYIAEAAERAGALTSQLLAFSRQQHFELVDLDVNEVVEGVLPMLRRLIGEDIAIEVGAAEHLQIVLADRGQLEQVLVNLAVNARDAMPGGGTITIETRSVEFDEQYVESHVGAHVGPFVCLTITDTGTGIEPAVLRHLFEPFFTTKDVGHGTGLGLATVHGIVNQSGGHIEVYSELGLGTSFKIYLPATAASATEARASRAGAIPVGAGTILVCEDDDDVRRYMGAVLSNSGYTVMSYGDPMEAVAAVRGTEPIDLVITDVVMPGMGGPTLADHLQELRPGIPVLFVSGYPEERLTQRVLPAGATFLQKPFRAGDLVAGIQTAISSNPGFDRGAPIVSLRVHDDVPVRPG